MKHIIRYNSGKKHFLNVFIIEKLIKLSDSFQIRVYSVNLLISQSRNESKQTHGSSKESCYSLSQGRLQIWMEHSILIGTAQGELEVLHPRRDVPYVFKCQVLLSNVGRNLQFFKKCPYLSNSMTSSEFRIQFKFS